MGLPKLDTPEVMKDIQARFSETIPQQSDSLSQDQLNDLVLKATKLVILERKLVDEHDREAFDAAVKTLTIAFERRYLGLGLVGQLMKAPGVSEIMINGVDDIWIEKDGELHKLDPKVISFDSEEQLRGIQQKIAQQANRRIDESSPLCDTRLPDGSRVNMTIPPISLDGPTLTIRRFPEDSITITQLIEWGSLSANAAEFLRLCVQARCNILVVGGTGAGKTTMLNALGNFISKGDRITTVEDAAELNLQSPHVVRLETRPPNAEGTGEITIGRLVKNTLRMRPDRVIIGECRSGEALDMLQAMNTGHDGSLSTLHANSPKQTVDRLVTMVMMNEAASSMPEVAIKRQIAGAVDLIVYCGKAYGIGKPKRMVTEITEVGGMESGNILMSPIFKHKIVDGEHKLAATGMRPAFENTRFQEQNLGRIPNEIFGSDDISATHLEKRMGK